ncbi:unnamed protein product [Polarella glacialis]|uniref:Uncharacterized protein n=1 Tax=Polarella glacialis TaxID=89957 RepID=A0A813E778_POLGL|nr:unnamed protein product [Polarella glacialis]
MAAATSLGSPATSLGSPDTSLVSLVSAGVGVRGQCFCERGRSQPHHRLCQFERVRDRRKFVQSFQQPVSNFEPVRQALVVCSCVKAVSPELDDLAERLAML